MLSLRPSDAWQPSGDGELLIEDLRALLAPAARRALLRSLESSRARRVALVRIDDSDELLLAVIVGLFLYLRMPELEIVLSAAPTRVNADVYRRFEGVMQRPGRLLEMLDHMLLSRLHHLIGAEDHEAIARLAPCLGFLDILGDGDRGLCRRLAREVGARKRNLQLMVTRRCHLRCVYCPADKRNEDLEMHHAERALELLLASREPAFRLDFAGGEPLLRKSWVRRLIETAHARAREAGKRDSYYLVTNAIELTPDFSQFLAGHDVELEISIDGDEATHNRNKLAHVAGLNPYRSLLRNFDAVRDLGIHYNAVLVFTPASFATLRRDLEHVLALGFRNVSLNYAVGYHWEPELVARYVELLVELVERYDMADKGEDAAFFIKNLLYKSEPTVLSSELMVDTDGSLHLLSEWQFKQAFRLNPCSLRYSLDELSSIDDVYFTKAQVYHLLYEIYRSPDGGTLRLVHNNVETGLAVTRGLKQRLGGAFSEGPARRPRGAPGTPGRSPRNA